MSGVQLSMITGKKIKFIMRSKKNNKKIARNDIDG